MKVKLSLSKFCKDAGIINDPKLDLIGTLIVDEEGLTQGTVLEADTKTDTIVCELKGPLADKIAENYKKENNNA